MKIALYGRALQKDAIPYVQQLIDLLYQRNTKFVICNEYYRHLADHIQFKALPELFNKNDKHVANKIDYMFSVGGDNS